MTDNLQGIAGLIITSSVLIAIPGPGILFLAGQALSAGKKNALKGVAGNAGGVSGFVADRMAIYPGIPYQYGEGCSCK